MNLPNALSLFRVILVPVYLCVFFSGMPYAHLIAAAVFLLAGLTDILDGRIARKYNQITLLGRILDPLADKLMVTSALVSLSMAGMIPVFVSVVYICKEILLSLGGEKVVALGSDFDGTHVPECLSSVEKNADFYEYLLKKNLNEDLVRDIFFENANRVFQEYVL